MALPPLADDFFEVLAAPDSSSPTAPGIPDTSPLPKPCNPFNKTVTFWYTNCRSVKNKLSDLKLASSALPGSTVILLTETWLDAGVCDAELLGQASFNVHRRDRASHSGGVLIAVPSSLPAVRRYALEHPELEAVFLELRHPKGSSLLVLAYCPPSTRVTAYELLDKSLTKALVKPYREVLLFGDFNSHIDWWGTDTPIPSDAADETLLGLVSTLGLSQICRSHPPVSSILFLCPIQLKAFPAMFTLASPKVTTWPSNSHTPWHFPARATSLAQNGSFTGLTESTLIGCLISPHAA